MTTPAVDPLWVQSTFDVGGRTIGVAVRRLDATVAARLAASLAWHTVNLLDGVYAGDGDEWPATLRHILCHHVTLTMDEQAVKDLDDVNVSSAVCAGAVAAFIKANGLNGSISRELATYLRSDAATATLTH
jgi:hypothetical protein